MLSSSFQNRCHCFYDILVDAGTFVPGVEKDVWIEFFACTHLIHTRSGSQISSMTMQADHTNTKTCMRDYDLHNRVAIWAGRCLVTQMSTCKSLRNIDWIKSFCFLWCNAATHLRSEMPGQKHVRAFEDQWRGSELCTGVLFRTWADPRSVFANYPRQWVACKSATVLVQVVSSSVLLLGTLHILMTMSLVIQHVHIQKMSQQYGAILVQVLLCEHISA